MVKSTIYVCEYCGKEFYTERECEQHEREYHTVSFENASTNEISDILLELADTAHGYHINGGVMGWPEVSFINLMEEAAKRLKENCKK